MATEFQTGETSFMRAALAEARRAAERGDVPVGAVVVRGGRILSRARNRREEKGDPTAHAEIEALRRAARKLGGWYLHDCVLYVTLEPCPMCAGAAMQARLAGIVFGAYDPKGGCCGSILNLPEDARFTHRMRVSGGLMEKECAEVLKDFFRKKRQQDE